MGCVHSDGGSPNATCRRCDEDEQQPTALDRVNVRRNVRMQLDLIKERMAEIAENMLFERPTEEYLKKEQEALANILQNYVDLGTLKEFVVRPWKETTPGKWEADCWLKFPESPIVELNMTIQNTGAEFTEDDTVSSL